MAQELVPAVEIEIVPDDETIYGLDDCDRSELDFLFFPEDPEEPETVDIEVEEVTEE